METELLIIQLLAFIVLVIVFVYLYIRSTKTEKTTDTPVQGQRQELVMQALKALNCQPEKWDKDNDDNALFTTFTYQGGHFTLRIEENSYYVRLSYLFFKETTMDNISLVRSLCNQCNMNSDQEKLIYTVDNEEYKINVHAFVSLLLDERDPKDMLERAMNNLFQWSFAFIHRFSDMEETDEKNNSSDTEHHEAFLGHEAFLLREQEMLHQEAGPHWHATEDDRITIKYVLAQLGGIADFQASSMAVYANGETSEVNGHENIEGFDLSSAFYHDGQPAPAPMVLLLTYYDARWPEQKRTLNIQLNDEGQGEGVRYYRITLTAPPSWAGPDHPLDSTGQHLVSRTALAGYEERPAADKLAEFRYMWNDACQKRKNNEDDQLSEEQKLIAAVTDKDEANGLYFGIKLFHQERFLQATSHLEDALRWQLPKLGRLKKKGRNIYYETCYYLGFCYNELGQYERAHYYLEQLLPLQRVNYTEEYVNCLVNGHDFRALNFITQLLHDQEAILDDDEETAAQEGIDSFLSFLRRRKATVLIYNGMINEAEELLKKLLDDPESSDFALNELARLQKSK